MLTIWAKGKLITRKGIGGQEYSYREDIGQVQFSTGWTEEAAMEHIKQKYPDAEVYVVGESGNGGLVSGWERDAMPGY